MIEMPSCYEANRPYPANWVAKHAHEAGLGIVASCLLFIFALAVSAYFEPPIRVLHTLQALIYVAVIGGALWHQKWAYGVGIGIAAFWNYVNLFVNTFIRNGVETLGIVISGGHVTNPGTIIAIPAALGHFGMIAFCFWPICACATNAGPISAFCWGVERSQSAISPVLSRSSGRSTCRCSENCSVFDRNGSAVTKLALHSPPEMVSDFETGPILVWKSEVR